MLRNIHILCLLLCLGLAIICPKAYSEGTPVPFDPENSFKVASGYSHVIAIDKGGYLWAWGQNEHGQIGDGGNENRSTPVKIMSEVKKVAAGLEYSLALKLDGTLWTWGRNHQGQLGSQSRHDRATPTMVLNHVVDMEAGYHHTLALKDNGELWVWGGNRYGQLGDGSRTDHLRPTYLMNNVISIASGPYHSFAVTMDGTLMGWGRNFDGRLGDGSRTLRNKPVTIAQRIDNIATGASHTLALKKNGTLLAWGKNTYGQVGDGTRQPKRSPVVVMKGVSHIDTGLFHSVAQRNDGRVFAWGWNAYGQLGDGSAVDSADPVPLMGKDALASIQASYFQTAALTKEGTVVNWGRDHVIEVDTSVAIKKPVRTHATVAGVDKPEPRISLVPSSQTPDVPERATSITAPREIPPVEVKKIEPPKVFEVASPPAVELAEKRVMREIAKPKPLPEPKREFRIDMDRAVETNEDTSVSGVITLVDSHNTMASLSLERYPAHGRVQATTGGFLYVPHKNYAGTDQFVLVFTGKEGEKIRKSVEVTIHSVDDRPDIYPIAIEDALEQGYRTSYSLDGSDVDSKHITFAFTDTLGNEIVPEPEKIFLLIDKGRLHITAPIEVSGPVDLPGIQVRAKADGKISSSFITLPKTLTITKADKPIHGLTDPVIERQKQPFEVAQKKSIEPPPASKPLPPVPVAPAPEPSPEPTIVKSSPRAEVLIAAGTFHSLALDAHGTLSAWGKNQYGQIGNGSTDDQTSPVDIMQNVVSVSAGSEHSLAVTSDGTLWVWGRNQHGQIGNGNTDDQTKPIKILENVRSAVGGADTSFALTNDGTLWGWGRNQHGQIGNGDTTDQARPLSIMDNVVHLAAPADHTFAVKRDGSLWGWGANDAGQLGTDTPEVLYSPVKLRENIRNVTARTYYFFGVRKHRAFFIQEDGSLWGWGDNDFGELGTGTRTKLKTPTMIMQEIADIATAGTFTLALKEDGSLLVWGKRESLYGNKEHKSNEPVLDRVRTIEAGYEHSLAVRDDSTIWGWGRNDYGQIGDGTTRTRPEPVKIR